MHDQEKTLGATIKQVVSEFSILMLLGAVTELCKEVIAKGGAKELAEALKPFVDGQSRPS